MKNNITVGESRLKGVVPRYVIELNEYGGDRVPFSKGENSIIEKVLSTPLPPVEDCVEHDTINMSKVINAFLSKKHGFKYDGTLARDISKEIKANSKAILKWVKD